MSKNGKKNYEADTSSFVVCEKFILWVLNELKNPAQFMGKIYYTFERIFVCQSLLMYAKKLLWGLGSE